MDVARFGLSRRPFRPVPAPEAYFPAATHEAALTSLRTAFSDGDGIVLLDGGPGTGKTLVALRLLEALSSDGLPLFVPSARFLTPAELHQAILFDLGKPYQGLTASELRLAVTDHLLGKKRAVLVLDEAHHLGPDLLEEVRLLDNLESKGGKAVFAVLVGPPAMRTHVEALPALAQRIGPRPRLDSLPLTESVGYLRHQLSSCGSDEAFTDEALHLIAAHAGGVPRVLNRLAGSALAVANDEGQESVDVEAAYEALSRAGVSVDAGDEESARPAYPVGAERSRDRSSGQAGQPAEPAATRQPKQPARKRRAE